MQRARRKINKILAFRNNKTIDFIICGTQKGGTSALNLYLREHPEICMADTKEVHFFDNDALFRNNHQPNYFRYHASFSPLSSHKVVGEATPIYMYLHDVPRRMWEYNPNLKLIVVLRNPIDRAYSHWNHMRSKKVENLPFWDAIQNEQQRCREALPYQHRVYSYADRGFYLEQLKRLWFYFSKDNVFVLKNESLREQPLTALNAVCDFLGVNHFASIGPKEVHSRSYNSEISDRERDYLRNLFELEIRGLEKVLGWDCRSWLSE